MTAEMPNDVYCYCPTLEKERAMENRENLHTNRIDINTLVYIGYLNIPVALGRSETLIKPTCLPAHRVSVAIVI